MGTEGAIGFVPGQRHINAEEDRQRVSLTALHGLHKDQSSVFTNNAWALTYIAQLVEDISLLTLRLLNAFCTGKIIGGAIQESRMRELYPKSNAVT